MRIELPRTSERFGANVFYGPVQVYELDSGFRGQGGAEEGAIIALPYERLHEIQRQMAVVVPVRGERIRLVEGILFAIPNQCLAIVVSNSPREPVDRFRVEQQALCTFARLARKRVVLLHQKDPLVGKAFLDAGYPELVGDDGLVRDGKAEGMLIALAVARLAGKRYLGFVDADNYSPGAAHEYICEYAAGFALAECQYAMVRILWQSKPKYVDGQVYFAKWGRTSRRTNHFLNQLISRYTGFETDIMATGNSGEHALTLELALRLDYATKYAVEPQHIISLLERFGGERESPYPDVMREGVEIFQIESRNPHFHRAGEPDHIREMTGVALRTIHGSFLCPAALRREIEDDLRLHGVLSDDDPPVEPVRRYPPLLDMDFGTFHHTVERRLQTTSVEPVRLQKKGMSRPQPPSMGRTRPVRGRPADDQGGTSPPDQ
ncbi:MAG: mannosyl-3-phosphoglycerate synthase [Gemmatimonadetes bacterium]|nr:mannosyl-3-phosphoglycerate synthase [Gemmatimonadota bacterium]